MTMAVRLRYESTEHGSSRAAWELASPSVRHYQPPGEPTVVTSGAGDVCAFGRAISGSACRSGDVGTELPWHRLSKSAASELFLMQTYASDEPARRCAQSHPDGLDMPTGQR